MIGHGPAEGPKDPCFLTCRAIGEVNVGRGQVWGRRGHSFGVWGGFPGIAQDVFSGQMCVKPRKSLGKPRPETVWESPAPVELSHGQV